MRNDVRDGDFTHVVENFEPPTEDENVLRYDGLLTAKEWIHQNFWENGI